MRRVVLPDEKRGIDKITKPVNQGAALVEIGYRVLSLDANPQASCSRPVGIAVSGHVRSLPVVLSDGISLSELILFSPLDCGYSIDAQSKLGCDTLVKPVHRWPAPIDTELPVQARICLSKAVLSPPEGMYGDTLVPCSPRLSPLRVSLTTAAGTLSVRLTCEVRPTRILLSQMGTPNRRNVSEARPGSPRPILARFAPKPDAVWREDNGSP
ncbi:MAG: hypothetical protein SXV54_20980 [Chloroflexota bacterium]|nr:hypothetical protein [Chloroflexota bacterium]